MQVYKHNNFSYIVTWIPVSATCMTPFVVNSLLLYGLAATLNRYRSLALT
ncbi:hypothetical protein [Wolbachia endosymbiont of Nomada leucophthalma]|nr:hypothetical protein [Wolbachia endosymbiont of Nomada leucophthalma]